MKVVFRQPKSKKNEQLFEKLTQFTQSITTDSESDKYASKEDILNSSDFDTASKPYTKY